MNAPAKTERAELALGLTLIGIAGCVDAIGFLRLRGLFVSFMSGNSTNMAVAFVQGEPDRGWRALAIVVSFVAGAVAGRLIARRAGARARAAVMSSVAILLAVSAALPGTSLGVVFPMVLAMGAQNMTLRKVGEVQTSLTYVTGTLVNLGQQIADAIAGERAAWAPYALMWLSMIAGAFAGAALYHAFRSHALFVPAAIVAALVAVTVLRPRK